MRHALRLSLLTILPLFALACGGTEVEIDERTEDEPFDDMSNLAEQGIVSCDARSATGYTGGRSVTITVVSADGRPAEIGTANAYSLMQAAAARDGVGLRVVSGYRTNAEQQRLYSCYVNCNCNGCNLAARPGYSNHQSGKALDLNTSERGVYDWLSRNASRFGFRRTVPSEAWHWEYFGGVSGGACAGGVGAAARTRSDLLVLARAGGSGTTEIHTLAGASNFEGFAIHAASGLHRTDGVMSTYQFAAGDFDRDGKVDVYIFRRDGANGKTEVHILSGASDYKTFALQTATALHATAGVNDRFEFFTGDYDGDDRSDIYVVRRDGANAKTEVHILSAASNFQQFSLHTATALHQTLGLRNFEFQVGDFDGDNRSDLYVFRRDGANGKTEVHILSAASNFQKFVMQTGTALHGTAGLSNFVLRTGDYDRDGRSDIYVVRRDGASSKTELHVLSAASNFQSFSLHAATGLYATTNNDKFEFHAAH